MASYQFQLQKELSLRQRVTNEIRNAIVQGSLQPGDKLKEGELASQMGISRGPVREAIRDLEAMGLVITHPYKETVVADVQKEEVSQLLIPVRRDLELYAIKKMLHEFPKDLFISLQRCIDEMQRFADFGDLFNLVEQDVSFHETIIKSSNSIFARQVWGAVVNHMRVHFLKNTKMFSDLHKVPEDHRVLLASLQSRNLEDITTAWANHINADALLF